MLNTDSYMWRFPAVSNRAISMLQNAGHEAYYVGGCVRDTVLGKNPKDFDVATSATPEQVQKVFNKTIPTGIKHGTVTAILEDQNIEITTFRSESDYADGRHPNSIKFETDLKADLARRDFTINAMAIDPIRFKAYTPRIIDPFNGLQDLKNGIIRAVGNPAERFAEDGLRCMRAARFAAVLGFDIEPETLAAISGAIPTFKKVSDERVREEFTKLIIGPWAGKGLKYLESTEILDIIFPFKVDIRRAGKLLGSVVGSPESRLALFFSQAEVTASEVFTTMKTMTYSTKISEEVFNILRNIIPSDAFEDWTDEQIRHWLAKATPKAAGNILWISRVLREESTEEFLNRARIIKESNPPLYAKDLALDGNEIKAIVGTKPSSIVGTAIRFLLEMVIGDPARNTKEKLTQLLHNNFACEDC